MKWPLLGWSCLALALAPTIFGQQPENPPVEAFVRGDSFPRSFEELSRDYSAAVTPELIAMLHASDEEDYWPRVAGMLGVVGDERAIEPLIDFVSRPESQPLPQSHHDARKAAIMSLGILVNRTNSERALTYLIEGLTPRVWRQRTVEGVPSWAPSYSDYDIQLSKYALFGLALSGNPRAGDALKSLAQSPTAEQARLRSGLDDTLEQWMEVYELVAQRGIAGMYKYYEDQRLAEHGAQPD